MRTLGGWEHVTDVVRQDHRRYVVKLPRYSAALLSVPIARGALR
jgi:hypothetical protein